LPGGSIGLVCVGLRSLVLDLCAKLRLRPQHSEIVVRPRLSVRVAPNRTLVACGESPEGFAGPGV